MTKRPITHTPGPYKGRVMGDTGNIRLYSARTAETIAYVLSREWGDYENAPDGETALKNFQLLRHAPAMLDVLQAAVAAWDEAFASDEPVSGADLVEWWGRWLETVRPLLTSIEQGQRSEEATAAAVDGAYEHGRGSACPVASTPEN